MATKMSVLVARARVPINDQATDEADRRYSDDDLLGYANDALRRLRKDRADLFLGQLTTAFVDKAATDNFPIDEDYMSAVVDYMVARAETRDDEEALESRARLFFELVRSATYG